MGPVEFLILVAASPAIIFAAFVLFFFARHFLSRRDGR